MRSRTWPTLTIFYILSFFRGCKISSAASLGFNMNNDKVSYHSTVHTPMFGGNKHSQNKNTSRSNRSTYLPA